MDCKNNISYRYFKIKTEKFSKSLDIFHNFAQNIKIHL